MSFTPIAVYLPYVLIALAVGFLVLGAGFLAWKRCKEESQKNLQKQQRQKNRDIKKQQREKDLASRPSKVIMSDPSVSQQTATKLKRGRSSVILLVEDSPTMMTTLRKILERWEYKVVTASDGRKAWAELQKSKPDLVISDIDMPELNGIELLKLMRSDLVLMSVPVILITASPYYHLEASQENGVNGLLSKPFEDKALLNQVRYLLQE